MDLRNDKSAFDGLYGFRSSQATVDPLTGVSDRIATAFNRSWITQATTGFSILVFFTNVSVMEFQVRYFVLFHFFSVIDCFEWFWMGSLHKNI